MNHSSLRSLTETVLAGMTMKVATVNGTAAFTPVIREEAERVIYAYESKDGIAGSLTAIYDGASARLDIRLTSRAALVPDAVLLPFSIESADDVLVSAHDAPWWMIGRFPKKNAEMPERTQGAILRNAALHTSVVMLCGDNYSCEADAKGLHLRIGCGGAHELHGPILTLCSADRPIQAVENNYKAAVSNGAIKVPLRKDRVYPAIFEKFGWCTWNTFYHDVTSEKIYTKLDEFRDKQIPIKWVIIDDGWSAIKDEKLMTFEADPEKFPEGFAACIARIKKEYGIEQVGVWHTFQGYWQGVHPESPLTEQFRGCLMDTMKGRVLPCNDPDKAFIFWDAWHTYLKDCGVDFVKVDNQSSACDLFEGTISPTEAARTTHIALERSVQKNFGGSIINCMGMDMINVLQRPYTAISRNSDDFFPDKENGFVKHLCQNVYNAIWHSQMVHCDYDMWWSGASAPVQSGVLRAISGSPVYVSDAQDMSCKEHILPVVGKDGDICRMDDAAMPTEDCIYVDCQAEKKLLKVFNRKGDALALAVFNLCAEPLTETFAPDAIPVLDTKKDYVLYEYFSQKTQLVKAGQSIVLSVAAGCAACYSFYPVCGQGESAYYEEGDRSRYVSCCVKTGRKVPIKALDA